MWCQQPGPGCSPPTGRKTSGLHLKNTDPNRTEVHTDREGNLQCSPCLQEVPSLCVWKRRPCWEYDQGGFNLLDMTMDHCNWSSLSHYCQPPCDFKLHFWQTYVQISHCEMSLHGPLCEKWWWAILWHAVLRDVIMLLIWQGMWLCRITISWMNTPGHPTVWQTLLAAIDSLWNHRPWNASKCWLPNSVSAYGSSCFSDTIRSATSSVTVWLWGFDFICADYLKVKKEILGHQACAPPPQLWEQFLEHPTTTNGSLT